MSFNYRNRRVHYWVSGIFAIPLTVIVVSGILLQLKKQITWVQPPESKVEFSQAPPTLDQIFEIARKDERLGIKNWADIERIDVRPSKGIAKVISDSGWEGQVSLKDGQLLQVAYRRSDFIESIHDGSFFGGNISKLGVFLTSAVALLLLLISGILMFFLPFTRRKKKRASA